MSDGQGTTDLEQFVIDTLRTRFHVPAEDLSPAVDLKTLGIDSLGGVELSLAIKKKYGVAFVAGEVRVDFTVADIAALTEKKLAEAEGQDA
ncbi:acyl carrier protein [Streptomyces sp. HPF1205]|uniref:acyl carrier protein n=1 Tax=Streptomyces sp. HPF1205 TaxID=2873262 RepID=UPI001CEC08BF|nr:acyl carrier protein [Streptomyces sp. HPF1205]